MTYQLKPHQFNINTVAFHVTLSLLATGSYDHMVILYDLTIEPPSIKLLLQDHIHNVRSIAFHPRLLFLTNTLKDNTIMFHDFDNCF